MSLKSSFNSDLAKELKLSALLDTYYAEHLKNYDFKRITNNKEQFEGVDVNFIHKTSSKVYHIDEKAQLDYINEDLPTFAFELSYLKNGKEKMGWLFDMNKKTDFYALITAIYSDLEVYTSCKITLVNRNKLIKKIEALGLYLEDLLEYRNEISHGRLSVKKLNPKTEGYLFLSKNNKQEQPLNLILKLDWLLDQKIGKRLA